MNPRNMNMFFRKKIMKEINFFNLIILFYFKRIWKNVVAKTEYLAKKKKHFAQVFQHKMMRSIKVILKLIMEKFAVT